MPVLPFRVFNRAGCHEPLPDRGVLSEFAARSQFLARRSTACIGWAVPFCRWPFPRLYGFPSPGRADDVKPSVHPVCEFRVPPEFSTRSSPPAAAGGHLSWAFVPFSTRGIGGPLARAVPPPATFRLQGLVTLLTAYALRALAGSISHRRRSWDSPFGAFSFRKVSAAFPRRRTHMPFRPPVFPLLKQWAGPTSCGFWALTLPGVPAGGHVVKVPTAGCSLGFRPLRVSRKKPCSGSHPSSSLALCATDIAIGYGGASEYRSASTSFRPHCSVTRAGGRNNPYRVLAPVRSWACGRDDYPGYEFTLHRVVHYCRPTGTLWVARSRSTRVARDAPEVPSLANMIQPRFQLKRRSAVTKHVMASHQ
jgi:hypothetical protein